MIHANVATSFSPGGAMPAVDPAAYVHPMAAVIGRVTIGPEVMVSPFASIRADEGQPIHVGAGANVQDGVVIHGLETEMDGQPRPANCVDVGGESWSVYIGPRVSLAHQSQVHGPAYVGADTFVGMQVLVFRSRVGEGCILEPGCRVMGVDIPPRRCVPAGVVIRDQGAVDALPEVTADHPLVSLNRAAVHVNRSLAAGYRAAGPHVAD